ncbi:MAG: hypothetical protein ACTHMQ_05295 [Protaetiibacter sp.]
MANGSISVLVSKDLQKLLGAIKTLEPETRKQIRRVTKSEALPIWKSEVESRSVTPLQLKVLVKTAKVSVSDNNIKLQSARTGKLRSGTPTWIVARPAEFGADPNRKVLQRSRRSKWYKRRLGHSFSYHREKGYVVYPAARDVIPRAASLWIQTTIRTAHEQLEKAGR